MVSKKYYDRSDRAAFSKFLKFLFNKLNIKLFEIESTSQRV
jgi:hypothetical protein